MRFSEIVSERDIDLISTAMCHLTATSACIVGSVVGASVIEEIGKSKVRNVIRQLTIFTYLYSGVDAFDISGNSTEEVIGGMYASYFNAMNILLLAENGREVSMQDELWKERDNNIADVLNCCRKHYDLLGTKGIHELRAGILKEDLYAPLFLIKASKIVMEVVRKEFSTILDTVRKMKHSKMDAIQLVNAVNRVVTSQLDDIMDDIQSLG